MIGRRLYICMFLCWMHAQCTGRIFHRKPFIYCFVSK